jgi:hypothetical protein
MFTRQNLIREQNYHVVEIVLGTNDKLRGDLNQMYCNSGESSHSFIWNKPVYPIPSKIIPNWRLELTMFCDGGSVFLAVEFGNNMVVFFYEKKTYLLKLWAKTNLTYWKCISFWYR